MPEQNPQKKLKILMIGTLDNRGGAARISWILGQELIKRGHDVHFLVGWKHSDAPYVREIPKNPFYYRLSKLFADDLRFSKSDWTLDQPECTDADIVHFHNIHSGFFNWSTFEKIVQKNRVLWTIHDIWPMTSGCTTAYACAKNTPAHPFGIFPDNRAKLLARKEKTYRETYFHTAAVSEWIDKKITESTLGILPHKMIYNAVDTGVFRPQDKRRARIALGLDQEKKIVLFVAPKGMHDTLKGAQYIQMIADTWKDNKEILFVGVGYKNAELHTSGNILSVGTIMDQEKLALYYAAADAFLYPSLADSFGLVVAEAMACGLPVVAFATDAIPEIILNEQYGYLATTGDVQGLEQGLEHMLSLPPEQYKDISSRCVQRIQEHFSLSRMVDEYEKQYQEMMSEPTRD